MGIWGTLGTHALLKTVDYSIMAATNAKVKRMDEETRTQIREFAEQANIQNRNLIVADTFANQSMLLPDNGILLLSAPNDSIRLAVSDPAEPVQNVVVTGSNIMARNHSLISVISDASARNIPIVLLHCSNHDIVREVSSNLPSNKSMIYNSKALSYNPFKGLDLSSICQLIYSSIPTTYGVKSIGRDFIRVMVNIQLLQGNIVDFQKLLNCPFNDLSASIDRKEREGFISKTDADDLKADLFASQSESRVIAHYFQDLADQINHLSDCTTRNAPSASISEGIQNRQAILIDIGVNTNTLLLDLIINQLRILFSNGYKFMIILDNVNLNSNKDLLPMTIHNSNCRFVLSYDDVYSALNSDENTFTSLLGSVQKAVVFNHPSIPSCSQWSKYLGEYDKQEPEYTHTQNLQGGAMMGQSSGNSMRIAKKREPRVQPEMINHLRGNEACIYDSSTQTVLFANIL